MVGGVIGSDRGGEEGGAFGNVTDGGVEGFMFVYDVGMGSGKGFVCVRG